MIVFKVLYNCLVHITEEKLYSILPEVNKKRTEKNKMKVSWEERDKEICLKVSNEINRILSDEKSQRLTISRIGKNLGLLSMLEYHLDKLPCTRKVLNNYYESTEEFQKRRVSMVLNDMERNNEIIKKWKIYRKAGLRADCSYTVKQKIDESSK